MKYGRIIYIICLYFILDSLADAQPDTSLAQQWFRQGSEAAGHGDSEGALVLFQKAAEIFSQSEYHHRSSDCKIQQCYQLIQLNQTEAAWSLIESCQNDLVKISDKRKIPEIQLKILLIRVNLVSDDKIRGQYLARARSMIDQDSALRKKMGAEVFMESGVDFFNQDQFDSCNIFMEQASPLAQVNLNLEQEGDICILWAKSLRRFGDPQKAVIIINQAINAYTRQFGTIHTKIATCYNDLAIVQQFLGDPVESGNSFTKALEIREQLFGRNTNEFASVLNNAALHYLDLKMVKKALDFANETIATFEKMESPDKRFHVASYNTRAKIFETTGNLNLAFENYQKAVHLHKEYFPGNSRIRFYYIDLGKNAIARTKYEEAVSYFHLAMSAAFNGIDSNNLDQNPQKDNPSNYQTLKTICLLKGDALHRLYAVSEDTTYLRKAIELYELSDWFATKNRIEVQYQKSRVAFSKQNIALYEGAIRANLQMWKITGTNQYLEKSFTLNEKSKSLTLLEDLLAVNALRNSDLPKEILIQEQHIQDSLTLLRNKLIGALENNQTSLAENLQAEIFQCDLKYENFKKKLEENYSKFFQSKYSLDFLSIDQIQSSLTSDQSLIEYFVGDHSIFIYTINQNEAHAFIINKPDSIGEWVSGLLQSIREYDFTHPVHSDENQSRIQLYIEYGGKLYDLIWKPFMDHLKEEVTIVPDAILNYLPFGTLLTDIPGDVSDFKHYPYLEKEYIMSYNYSATLGRQMTTSEGASSGKLLAIAPEFGDVSIGSTLRPLLFNVEEAKAIAKLFKGNILSGKEANEDHFRTISKDYGLFHFATHAIVNESNPDHSFLAFQGGNGLDSHLYLGELYAIRLPSQMVTLSACQTNVGPLLQGEGLASLAKGFSYAGARSIVTSMWDVEDHTAKDLMLEFYHRLEDGQRKSVSLHEAKLQYLTGAQSSLGHPYFWATFIAIGDMSPLEMQGDTFMFYLLVILSLIFLTITISYFKRRWKH